jgi:3-deoxy-D-manno-octulosonic-acid transferase
MNRNLYSLLGYMLLPVMLLRLLIKSIKNYQYRQRVGERFGFIVNAPVPIIWVHCVSVGEFRAATVLIEELINDYPDHRLLVTTTTPTGSAAVIEHYQQRVLHFYFPFDIPFIVNRYIKKINPSICILLETEIWPNLIRSLNKKHIPVILVNARLSQRSLIKYKRFANKLSKQTLNQLTLIATQNHNSSNRFTELGALPGKVVTAGNIKFDQKLTPNKGISKQIRAFSFKRSVIVFASTHKGEESLIIKSYLKFKDSLAGTLLVVIPRHPERFDDVYKLAKKNKLSIVKRSSNEPNAEAEMMIGDSMGEMMSYFDVCDIAYIGGSLNNTGGHNMLEPAILSKPIIFGPNVFNFAEISSTLISSKGAIQIKNADELFEVIIRLTENKNERQELGHNAYKFFSQQQGATKRISQQIKTLL